jgi:adenylate cyclase
MGAKDLLLRLMPNIRYGTERYTEKVARRLRVINIATWIAATQLTFFTLVRLMDPVPGRWQVAVATAVLATIFAAIPLLHRFGPWIATYAFILTFLIANARAGRMIGTAGGTNLVYLALAGLAILLFGVERLGSAIVVSVLAAGLIVIEQATLPADTGFVPASVLLRLNFTTNVVTCVVTLFVVLHYAMRQAARAEAVAERERARSESLLANILPADVAARLKDAPLSKIADAFPEASILFADMAGYTSRASDVTPSELVRFLNAVYTRLDALVERHGLEKIKTTGDSYMAVSGVPVPRPDHAAALAVLALAIKDAVAGLVDPRGRPVPVRIGMASGPVVAGVVGTHKYSYDVWGDAVNMASRMESTGEPGKIQVAPSTYELLKDQFEFVARDPIEVRGKGHMHTWFLTGQRKMQQTHTKRT